MLFAIIVDKTSIFAVVLVFKYLSFPKKVILAKYFPGFKFIANDVLPSESVVFV